MMNPQVMLLNMLKQQAGSNPVLNNALGMAEKGDMKGVETLCRNICRERGIDPDKMMQQANGQIQQMMNQFGNMKL